MTNMQLFVLTGVATEAMDARHKNSMSDPPRSTTSTSRVQHVHGATAGVSGCSCKHLTVRGSSVRARWGRGVTCGHGVFAHRILRRHTTTPSTSRPS